MARKTPSPYDGLLVIDKPAGVTSHDVVARVRRLAGTHKVGHAGTLDPMATGVLVVGLGRATRLLGYLSLGDKSYRATARLGATTVTDDADGETLVETSAVDVDEAAVRVAVTAFVGRIAQVPSAVSAVKIDGKTGYARVRAGEDVVLPPREVTISALEVEGFRRDGAYVDVELDVTCSSGTYVRAIARDLGAALGVGGHVTALRRTRVGPFALDGRYVTPAELSGDPWSLRPGTAQSLLIPLDDAVTAAFPRLDVGAATAHAVSFGQKPVAPDGVPPGPVGVFGPDGLVALMEQRGTDLRSLVVFTPGSG